MSDSVHPSASFWLDVIDRAAKVAAVGVAGYWAVWNHVKKRTYKERLQPQVEVRELDAQERLFLIELSVENVGNSLIKLQDVRICSLTYLSNALINLREDAYDVFKDEEMIEPGESIQEQLLVASKPPLEGRVLRVEFILYAGDRFRWKTEKIILLQTKERNDSSHQDDRQVSAK